jgi:hypothetical protein
MTTSQKPTRRQLAVIEDLFTDKLDEQGVLDKHKVARGLYERWLTDERFLGHLERRMARSVRRSHMILARQVPHAVTRLVELTKLGQGETARKACLDIISMNVPTSPRPQSETSAASQAIAPEAELSPEVASRLLAALAKESSNENATP